MLEKTNQNDQVGRRGERIKSSTKKREYLTGWIAVGSGWIIVDGRWRSVKKVVRSLKQHTTFFCSRLTTEFSKTSVV